MVVCVIGILHYFKIDPIGFKVDLIDKDYRNFTSTIGNINTYTSYLSLIHICAKTLLQVVKDKPYSAFCTAVHQKGKK